MALLGASHYFPTKVRISSLGQSATDGWSEVTRLAGADLPDGTAEYSFVVWGVMGDWDGSGPAGLLMEVALGTQTTVFQDSRCKMTLFDAAIQNNVKGRPFFFVRNYRVSGAGTRGNWTSTNDLVLWARVYANKNPPLFSGHFSVGAVTMLAFSIAPLALGEHFADRHLVPQGSKFGAGSMLQLYQSGVAGLFTAGAEWLFFGSLEYEPENPGTSHYTDIRFQYSPNPPSIGFSPILGYSGATGSSPLFPLGMHLRGLRSAVTENERLFIGGFRTFQSTSTTGQLSTDGGILPGSPPVVDNYFSTELFMVRIDAFDANFLVKLQKDPATLKQIYNEAAASPINIETQELALPFGADLEVISHSRFMGTVLGANFGTRSFGSRIDPKRKGELYDQIPYVATNATVSRFEHEGAPNCLGTRLVNMPGVAQIDFTVLGNPLEGGARTHQGADQCALVFVWDDSLVYSPYNLPAVPPTVVVVPPRESLDTSSLNALPIEPDHLLSDQMESSIHALEADDGTRITWPGILSVRRRFLFAWTGLAVSDRDTLLSFFLAQGNRAFKWTEPGGAAALALVMVGSPATRDLGNLQFAVEVQALELLYTGP